ncbi:YfhO family protein [Maribacter sp. 2308TA10-17]|uniref:YfhO family protein n=1 Tax=Maribacter sp. 2308TA10-17 TaxID=3386276 RepID=UPI0039BD005C
MKTGFKAFLTHFFVAVFFVIVALAYFSPVLQGKVISQHDIKQFVGMAKEQNDFRKQNDGQEPYWTNSSFGGMPTYQLGAYYPHDYVKKLDILTRFLPRPADYLFLYFIGFYILLCCMKVDWRLAIVGALAYGFSTYLIIIFGAGHNAKAHALGYLPMLLGGIILVFRKKYLWGFVLTSVAMALEIRANHYQMTYYFMLLVLILGVVYLVDAIRKKYIKHFLASVGILLVAVFLGIAANATGLMATKEYADWSTRGPSKLTMKPDGSLKEESTGLDKAYITRWSYGVTESLNLFVPRLFGGASSEDLGEDSKTFDFLIDQGLPKTRALDFSSQIPTYWGDQPVTSGPAYIGAIIFFLFILGLILVRKKAKWWLLGGVLMSLFLSWGKNFGFLTDLMIDYFPLYNKFRAVSSIQVILELCAPILAILALAALFNPSIEKIKKMNALKIAFFSVVGLCVLLFVFKGTFSFEGPTDRILKENYGVELYALIKLDREAIYNNDLFRSFMFVLLTAIALWFFLKEKLKQNVVTVVLGALIVFDLVGVNLRYVNNDNFVSKRAMNQPFKETMVDREIKKDKGIYRVFDQSQGFEGARTSYFHKAISGYHAAKPAGIQDLFEYQIVKGNMEVLNMLNVKYVVQQDEEGRSYPAMNPEANGNAWFVSELKKANDADEEIKLLEGLKSQREAIINIKDFPNINRFAFRTDSTANISLKTYQPNHLTYTSANTNAGVAVFSEMYYAKGWNAYIDGMLQDHFRVNYVLRALRIPEGEHTIEFKFEPEVVKIGSQITLASSILLGLIILGGIGFTFWKYRKEEEKPQA